ncbi:MAG: response regulator transcription factor [Candidatus Omnitrophica bacterium]|nr:response regulator transcription factor [Candidatus Omnitrophota bacterium]
MKCNILLVDDNHEFRKFLKEFLLKEELNITIIEAPTGEMGVATALVHKPDLILMDVRLPNTSGIAAAKMIKQECPECEIIILTMFMAEEIGNLNYEEWVSHIIDKGEIYDRLLPVIKDILKEKTVLM